MNNNKLLEPRPVGGLYYKLTTNCLSLNAWLKGKYFTYNLAKKKGHDLYHKFSIQTELELLQH